MSHLSSSFAAVDLDAVLDDLENQEEEEQQERNKRQGKEVIGTDHQGQGQGGSQLKDGPRENRESEGNVQQIDDEDGKDALLTKVNGQGQSQKEALVEEDITEEKEVQETNVMDSVVETLANLSTTENNNEKFPSNDDESEPDNRPSCLTSTPSLMDTLNVNQLNSVLLPNHTLNLTGAPELSSGPTELPSTSSGSSSPPFESIYDSNSASNEVDENLSEAVTNVVERSSPPPYSEVDPMKATNTEQQPENDHQNEGENQENPIDGKL